MTDSSNLSSWGGLEEPQSPCNPSGFCGAPRMPRSFPTLFFTGAALSVSTAETEGGKDARKVFLLLSCISNCNLTPPPPLWSRASRPFSSPSPFSYSLLQLPPPPLTPRHRPSSPLTGVSLSVPVLRQTRRGSIATVISIRRTGLLICLPACQSACSPACLRACLPARALPTAMPYSCPIHLLLNKRLLSSGHPSLHWPLFLHGEAQE